MKVMLINTGNSWQYGDRQLLQDSGPGLAAFSSLLKDYGIHGEEEEEEKKNHFMVTNNKHTEISRNSCLWTPQNPLDVH